MKTWNDWVILIGNCIILYYIWTVNRKVAVYAIILTLIGMLIHKIAPVEYMLTSLAPYVLILLAAYGLATRSWRKPKSERFWYDFSLKICSTMAIGALLCGFWWDVRDVLPVDERQALRAVTAECSRIEKCRGGIGRMYFDLDDRYKNSDIQILHRTRLCVSCTRSFIDIPPPISIFTGSFGNYSNYTRYRTYAARIDGIPNEVLVFAGLSHGKWKVLMSPLLDQQARFYGSYALASFAGYDCKQAKTAD